MTGQQGDTTSLLSLWHLDSNIYKFSGKSEELHQRALLLQNVKVSAELASAHCCIKSHLCRAIGFL